MKLAAKLIGVTLALIVALTAVAGYFSVRSKYDEFEAAQRRLAQTTATAIESELDRAWQADGLAGVGRFLEKAISSEGSLKVRWVWLDPAALPEEGPRIRFADQSIPFGETISIVALDAQGGRSLLTYVPVRSSPSRPAALEFSESLAPLERRMWRDIGFTLGLIGAVALVSIVTAYVAGIGWVARPLGRLITKTERIGRGDFSEPLRLASRDELAQLAEALNTMCVHLEGQKKQIANESDQRLAVEAQLRHADRLKTVGRLAAGVGHELGTPLNVISGRAALIDSGRLDASQVRESARVIKDEADRISGIVRQLLDFARRRPPQRATLDLRDVLARTIDLLQPMAEKNSVRLRLASPELETDPLVQADAGQLQQVLTNIVMNAIQAMPSGGDVTLELAAVDERNPTAPTGERPAPYWRIGITDQGLGIGPEHLPHIFEPFFTTKDVSEGTGLGLSIAYGIVQEHVGWIGVRSRVGGGSRFDVYLPRENG
jgi:signal transduction histidine kinase